jgi:peptide/nickel transport system substrate-binding protein
MESFVVKDGTYAYGSHPEIDALFPQQAREMDPVKRIGLLHRMQDILDRETMYVSIWQLAFISAVGPRVGESSIGSIKGFVYTAPYEDLTLKGG